MAIRNLSGETVDGIVGIGTTNLGTEARLHVGKTAATGGEGAQMILQKSNNGSLAAHLDNFNSTNDYLRILKGDDTTSSALVSVFDLTNIRLGIGVYPEKELDVSGNARLQGGDRKLIFNNGSVETSLDQMAGAVGGLGTLGRFGVGTVAPNNNLQVVGNITIGTGATNEAVRNMMTGGTMVLQSTDANHRIIIRGTQDAAGAITGNSNNMDFYEFGGYNFYTGVNTGSSARTLALSIASDADATFAGDVNVNTAATNGASIRLIHPGSSENPEIRIQSGESGTTAFSIYNTATDPDAEQFFINNTLGVSHLGNKRGALKLETNSGVNLTLSGANATFAGTITVNGNATNLIDGIQTNTSNTAVSAKIGTLRLNYAGGPNAGDYGASLLFTQRWHSGTASDIVMGQIAGVKVGSDGNFGGGLTFFTGNGTGNDLAERMRIQNDGYVGIGTTSPSSYNSRGRNLVISGSGDVGISIDCSSANSGSIVFADGTGGTAGYRGIIEYDHADDSMALTTAATERMRILAGGTGTFYNAFSIQGDDKSLIVRNAAGTVIGTMGAESSSTPNVGMTTVRNNGTTTIQFNSNGSSYINGGNVGIGTTSPASKLQVRIGGIGSNANDEVDGVIFEGDRHDLIFKQIRTGASSDWNSTTFRLQNRVDTTLMSSIDFVTDASFNRHIDINTASNSFNTRFTHDGKVGIGYTNPGSKLSVNGDGGFVSNSSSRVLYLTQQSAGNGNIIQFLDQSGNNVWELVGRDTNFYIYNNQNSVGYVFESNASNGYVAILKGGTDASYPLDVTGSIRSTADVIAYSDRRVKENIKTIDNALDKVTKLRGVSYNRKDIEDKSTKIGVIAQEVKDILPEVVDQDGDDKYSVAYGNMAGLFIEAIKELKAEIQELKKSK